MKTPRIALAAALVALAGAARAGEPPPVVDPAEPRLLRAGPLLGHQGHDAIVVWAIPPSPTARLEVAFAPVSGDSAAADTVVPVPPPAEGALATSVRLEGLAPGGTYRYRVLVDGRADEGTSGTFRMPPPPGTPVRETFALVSCMNVRRHARQPAWLRLLDERPDLLIHLGDNIYANSTDPPTIRGWYEAQRRVPEYAAALRRTPAISTWDDHDFGQNDGDGMLPGKERSLATFLEMWPNPSAGTPDAPGVFVRASYGDVDIFLLDGRYHRTPNGAQDDERKTMLGEGQWRWLEKGLLSSRATFKLVGSGSLIGAGLKDSWQLYTHDRERLLALTRKVPGIIFLSGDIHNSLVGRVPPGPTGGYATYEIVSSGVAVNQGTHWFVTLGVDTAQADPSIEVRIHKVDAEGAAIARDVRTIRRSELVPSF